MGKKIRIGFDLDGVLVDFTDEFVNRLNTHLLTEGRHGEFIHTPIEDYWFFDNHIDFFETSIKEGIFADCLSYPESVVYVNKLLENPDLEIFFVTARGSEKNIHWTKGLLDKIKRDTKNWVTHYFPKFKTENLFFCGRKDGVIFDNRIQYFVEDRADSASRLSKVCRSFLLERDWNKKEYSEGSIRIKSLAELEFFLNAKKD